MIEFNKQGFIPGPNENNEDFEKRVTYCLQLKNELGIKEGIEDKEIYGFSPKWVPLLWSREKLAPWHGGCAWIFQMTKESPLGAFFQLKPELKFKNRYLGIYSKKELINHELAHIGRMAFDEPIFEEILAYRNSPSRFRRIFGPLFQSAWESALLVGMLFLIFLADFYFVWSGDFHTYNNLISFKLLPIGFLTFLTLRLFYRHFQFRQCWKKLNLIFKDKKSTDEVIYRLTDYEIIAFSKKTVGEIYKYLKGKCSLRHELIRTVYIKKNDN